MRIIFLTLLVLSLNVFGQFHKKDTLISYWLPNYDTYSFDTIINQTNFRMKTYCLNDSAVYNETFTIEGSKNNKLIEYSVAHNFATDFTIKTADNEIKLHLIKENFKDSLSSDFFKICHMWKNEFSHVENGQLIFRATFAKPDTDYQFAILYLVTEKGDIRILKVEDESFYGLENE